MFKGKPLAGFKNMTSFCLFLHIQLEIEKAIPANSVEATEGDV